MNIQRACLCVIIEGEGVREEAAPDRCAKAFGGLLYFGNALEMSHHLSCHLPYYQCFGWQLGLEPETLQLPARSQTD